MKKFKLLFVFLFLGTIGAYAQSEISDTDGDTKIETERTADNDQIFFQTEGTDRWLMKSTRIEPYNSGNSIHIGVLAGENDDLTNNQNVFIGDQAGRNTTSGDGNVALGRQTLRVNTTGYGNMAIGALALNNNNGFFNVGIGSNALQFNTTGVKNMGIGQASLRDNTTGRDNVGIGANAFENNQTGNANLAMGSRAGFGITNGSQNVLLGFEAGDNAGLTSGNVMIGYQAGQNATGANQLYIDNSNTADPLIYGKFDTNELTVNGSMVIDNPNTVSSELIVRGSFPFLTLQRKGANDNSGFVFTSENDLDFAYLLHDNSTDVLRLVNNGSGLRSDLEINTSGNTGLGARPLDDAQLYVAGNEVVNGSLAVDTTGSQTFFVDATTSKVGVGTTVFDDDGGFKNILNVHDGDIYLKDSEPFIEINNTGTQGGGLILMEDGEFETWITRNKTSGLFSISHDSNSQYDDLTMNDAGNTGLGSNPLDDARLYVEGNEVVNGSLAVDTTSGDHTFFVDAVNNKVGIGRINPEGQLHVETDEDLNDAFGALFVENLSTAPDDAAAVRGEMINTTPGFGYGGRFLGNWMGVRGTSQVDGSGTRYGVFGEASGTGTGTRYGVYGSASGGDRAYAMYAFGDLKATDRVFIGTTPTDEDSASTYELLVDGEIICEGQTIEDSNNWPDYVFEQDYALPSLQDVKAHIEEHKHLMGVPSQEDIEAFGGLNVAVLLKAQMEKIEELTLYAIDADEKIAQQDAENVALKELLYDLSSRIEKLEQK